MTLLVQLGGLDRELEMVVVGAPELEGGCWGRGRVEFSRVCPLGGSSPLETEEETNL